MKFTQQRLNNVKNNMSNDINKIDIMLITKPENVFYISGFTGGEDAYLLITQDKNYILTDSRYYEQVEKECENFELIKIEKTFEDALKSFCILNKIEKIAFEEDGINYSQYKKLLENLRNVALIPAAEIVEKVRLIKDEAEIQNIAEAAQIADKGFEHILKYIKPGAKEIDIALELEFFMRKNGASALSFETIVASGKRSSMPHGTASQKIIENGDFVTLDFGCIYKNYCSDMTRTVVVGEASAKQKEIYNIVLNANEEVLKHIKPGVSAPDIDKIARDIISQAGYGQNFGHGLGHGVGVLIHEAPRLSPRGIHILQEGMIVTDEPGIYISDFGGVRIEDLVCVTENGVNVLSKSPKELIIV